jgi:hypothetical protein
MEAHSFILMEVRSFQDLESICEPMIAYPSESKFEQCICAEDNYAARTPTGCVQ